MPCADSCGMCAEMRPFALVHPGVLRCPTPLMAVQVLFIAALLRVLFGPMPTSNLLGLCTAAAACVV